MNKETNQINCVKIIGIDAFGLPIEKKDQTISGQVIYQPETIRVHRICHNKVKHMGVYPINVDFSKNPKIIERPLCDFDFTKSQKDELIFRHGLTGKDFLPISKHVPIEPDEKYILMDDESVPVITNEGFTHLDDLDDE